MQNIYNCVDTSNIVAFAGPGDTLNVVTICDGDSIIVGWTWYSTAGMYIDSLIDINATDSVIITLLTVTTLDTTLIISGDTLIAHAGYASYVWVDCSTGLPVAGANNNTLPVSSGSYAVQLTDSNGCSEITPCFTITGINDPIFSDKVIMYPNPASMELVLLLPDFKNANYIITDVRGRQVHSDKLQKEKSTINISGLLSGVYFVTIFHNDETVIKKLVVY
jgi:hypothetical protein